MSKEITNKQIVECYQPLFDLMHREHDRVLTVSEMDEIIKASFNVYNMLNEKIKHLNPTPMSKEEIKAKNKLIAEIRTALADYIATEGCSCCRDNEGHDKAMDRLGKLLRMRKYKDGSGYDHSLYRTKK